MTKAEGLKEIDEAKWDKDPWDWFILKVHDEKDRLVECHLSLRPNYCDRGHIQFTVDKSHFALDGNDSFPRFFFSAKEADQHVRAFLKWRIWKERIHSHSLEALLDPKTEDSRAAGLEKAAEICKYHSEKYGNTARINPAWIAACDEIKTSCLATAGRIRRGEYENPTSHVSEPEGSGAW